MSSWLQTFSNRISLTVWYFLAALIISLAIAAFTVGFQAFKAASINPSKSLKTE
jgi:ABC-type antimicrobial peptide transport system permease subunit